MGRTALSTRLLALASSGCVIACVSATDPSGDQDNIASGTDGLTDLMQTMTEHRIRHVPVVADGRLTGIISIGDVVKSRIGEHAVFLEVDDAVDHYVLNRDNGDVWSDP